nr:YggU family protein [Nanoarchaeota archaeon]
MINPADYIIDNSLRIIVKPGKKQNYILGYDYERKALIVEIKARAQDNKANKEIVKFFSKLLKKRVKIKSGHTSKDKILIFS